MRHFLFAPMLALGGLIGLSSDANAQVIVSPYGVSVGYYPPVYGGYYGGYYPRYYGGYRGYYGGYRGYYGGYRGYRGGFRGRR